MNLSFPLSGDLVDGALLQSPTREKLEPVIPRRKEDNSEQVSKSAQKSTSGN